MSLSDAKALLAEALPVAPATLGDEARLGAVEAWDSLAHMRLILAIEEKRGAPLDAETAAGIESLADIARVLAL